ncbi:MAG: SDR family oxidoreductase [Myxococcales bacterium]|nr:SDR family oxidoreductase [Myxococcales bacterium]MCB9751993.1 SDR family oxidoreductase [Myxococcales bacterium]
MDSGLSGLTALITGASGGIGGALARAFAGEGCRLALHANSRPEALSDQVEALGLEGRASVHVADLRAWEQAERMLSEAVAAHGRVDVCIVNAGVWPPEDAPLHAVSPARVRDVLEVNLHGAIWTARAFARALAERGPRADGRGASVCLIGSTAGRFGEAGHLAYAVSKAGLHGLMRSLKNELVRLDPYARVNVVEPGWTATPMARAAIETPGHITRALQTMPVRQLARARDIADAALFLSAPGLARHVSGEILTVAGGMEGRRLWAPGDIDEARVRDRLADS